MKFKNLKGVALLSRAEQKSITGGAGNDPDCPSCRKLTQACWVTCMCCDGLICNYRSGDPNPFPTCKSA
ncbi:hypothetical protein D3C87_1376670 [compost metagenome]